MGMLTFASEKLINFVFRNQEELGNFDTIRIVLKKTDGSFYENGTGATDYIAVNRDAGAWNIEYNGDASNKTSLDFPPNQTGGTVSINRFVLRISGISLGAYDLFDGNIVDSSGNNTTLNIPNGETPRMNVGSIVVKLDNLGYFTSAFQTIIARYLFMNDKSNFGDDFCFKAYNNSTGYLANQEQGVARANSNFSIVSNGSYNSVTNSGDIVFPLYSGASTSITQIRFFYGTFPNNFSTYTYGGVMTVQSPLTINTFKTLKIPANTLDGMFK